MRLAILTAALLAVLNSLTYSCTTFCIQTENEVVFGKNYDWVISCGYVMVNHRDIEKIAYVSNGTPARWTSKYGSVTFNQFGREFPCGGMNEEGLVIELMWLDGTKYPDADERPAAGGTLQWIQYQLDNSASVEDVITSDKSVRISPNSVPIHYLVADKSGKCVTIEFLDGKLVYHTGETMMFKVLTNDTYGNSVEFLKKHEGFGGTEQLKNDNSSLDRFVKTCLMVRNYTPAAGKTAVDYGFEILKSVDQGEYTRWSIIYDIKNKTVYFRTSDNTKIKNIDLAKADFDCNATVKMIDVNADSEGNVNSSMIDYSYDANRRLIEDSYSNVDFLKGVKNETKDKTAQYPEVLKCRGKSDIENREKISSPIDLIRSPIDLIRSPIAIAAGFLVLSAVVVYKYKYRKK